MNNTKTLTLSGINRSFWTGVVIAVIALVLFSQVDQAAAWKSYPSNRKYNHVDVDYYMNDTNLDALVTNASLNVDWAITKWDTGITGSNLDLDEVASIGSSDFSIDAIDFDNLGSDPGDIPGWTSFNHSGGTIYSAAAWLNSDSLFTWYTDGTMDEGDNKADVWTIALHEIGHAIGFEHKLDTTPCDSNTSTGSGKVQWNSAMCVDWTVEHTTNSDDQAGVVSKYGS